MLKVATQKSEEEVVDECGSDSGKHSHRDNYHHEADTKSSKSQARSSSQPGRTPMSVPHLLRGWSDNWMSQQGLTKFGLVNPGLGPEPKPHTRLSIAQSRMQSLVEME
jgi:hypothetical protein